MTASLPADVQQVFERFVTTELTTVDASGQPITWPVTPYYRRAARAIDITTGIGYPKKADDAARNPHVSLLFSDPTGLGHRRPVRGARAGHGAGRRHQPGGQPRALLARERREAARDEGAASAGLHARLVRLVLHCASTSTCGPERVFVWREGDFSEEPTLLRLAPGGGAHEALRGAGGAPAPARGRIGRLGRPHGELGRRHTTAVLSVVGPDGFPLSSRGADQPDRSARPRAARRDARMDAGGVPTRVCLTAHEHDPEFRWQANFQVRGDLVPRRHGWSLVPHKFVGGFELPKSKLQAYRENFSKIRRYRKKAKAELARRKAGPRSTVMAATPTYERTLEQLLLLRRAEVHVHVLDLGVLVEAVACPARGRCPTACSRRTGRCS